MNPSIHTFLGELYEIDPGLREHEQQLIPLIEELLHHDPAQSPDTAFVTQLRTRLREHAHTLSLSPSLFDSMNKWLYALGGAVTVALILPVAYLGYQNGFSTQQQTTDTPLFSFQVKEEGERAFGPLGDAVVQDQNARNEARPQSGGGGMPSTTPMPPMTGGGGDGDMSKLIAPYPSTQYNYVYKGDIKDLQDKVAVYKRNISSSNISITNFLDRMNLGTINLSGFKNANLDNISFSQQVPFGYQIYVNLRDGSVSINSNWEQWPQNNCQTDACWQAQQVKIGDVPADDVLISIAQKFAEDYGIDLSHYGAAEVESSWRAAYAAAADKSTVYIPESQRVIFPLMIDGKPLYDQSGIKTGISMGVHVKHKKISDVWGIMDRSYQKSDYAGVQDAKQIQDYLATVDKYPYHTMDNARGNEDIKNVDVVLGEPVLSYATFYKQTDMASNEVLVPSLIFPVTQTEGVYRQSIVVPLAQELLDQQIKQGQPMPIDAVPTPRPM